jgi:WD40 repeat protein
MRARVAIVGAVIAACLGWGETAVQADLVTARLAQLTYVTGANGTVWIADFDGRHPSRLGPGTQPLISPDGLHVAASLFSSKGNALVVYSPGARTRRYFDISKQSATALSWSSTSRYLAVALSNVNGTGGSLAIVDTQTRTVKTIATGSVCGASFSPDVPERLVYGIGPASAFCARSDIDVVAANGTGRTQITHGGRSLNPVWGARSVAFDRETLRHNDAPVYQIWLMQPDGIKAVQLTHIKVPVLLDGLVPRQYSGDGKRLLAQFEGQDTSETWTIDLRTNKALHRTVNHLDVTPGGLSFDGKTVLIDYGGFANPPSAGTVETIPFAGGGTAKVLVKHAGEPNWNL